jgi:hypothetical protein
LRRLFGLTFKATSQGRIRKDWQISKVRSETTRFSMLTFNWILTLEKPWSKQPWLQAWIPARARRWFSSSTFFSHEGKCVYLIFYSPFFLFWYATLWWIRHWMVALFIYSMLISRHTTYLARTPHNTLVSSRLKLCLDSSNIIILHGHDTFYLLTLVTIKKRVTGRQF